MSRAQGALFPARVLYFLLPAGCLCFAILLGLADASGVPDATEYRLLALGQRAVVPAPFSARILGPAAAAWLGGSRGVDAGFLLLGVLCLVALVTLIAGMLQSWRAPMAMFAAIFLMPFWVDIFHDYYLPDLLHAALLAGLLACLLFGQTSLAMLLLFPAYLARESTVLVAVCLIFAAWRRIGIGPAVIGVVATVCGVLVSARYGHAGPASVHGLSGGIYIVGKLVWNFPKNVLGLPLWSNTLPECSPIWTRTLGRPIGAIRVVGLCQPSMWGPGRLLLAWFGIFGIAPAFAVALGKRLFLDVKALDPGLEIVLRFGVVYGSVSILMTPFLGASVDRLVEYGWPLCLVALPWFICRSYPLRGGYSVALLAMHLGTCWLAWYDFGGLFAAVAVLFMNGLAYAMVRRLSTAVDKLWIQPVRDPSL